MLLRTACATSLLALAAPTAPNVYPYPDDPRIALVDCFMGRGSAFRVSSNLYMSVNHVTSQAACYINNKPVTVIRADPFSDFSIVRINQRFAGRMAIDCGGFKAGRRYTAIGHARGLQSLTAVELVATGEKINGFARLKGIATVIPGQSGGPIIDAETGSVVGTVNVYNSVTGDSGSVPLSETEVCSHA